MVTTWIFANVFLDKYLRMMNPSGKYYSLLDTTAQYLVYAPREKVLLSGYFSSY